MKKQFIRVVVAVALLAFVVVGVNNVANSNHEIKRQRIDIETTEAKLKLKQLKVQEINEQLDEQLQKSTQDQEKIQKLESDIEALKLDLQAKRHREATERERLARAAQRASGTAVASAASTGSGNCDSWKAQAGIPNTHATRTLINNESGCRWWAVNPTSGACGIPQAYPCSKLPCPLTEAGAVCQLKWMKAYVAERYGTWEKALSFWYAQCGTSKGCWY